MHGSLEGVTEESDLKSLTKILGTLLLKEAVSIQRAIDLRMLKLQDFDTRRHLSFDKVNAARIEIVNIKGNSITFGINPDELVQRGSKVPVIKVPEDALFE
ncbi:hypothetical protein DSO57_1007309 [Entomophthora muscae]|uniref:Uncharacterized protein n=2 Tax=Entomophthora muscae TaxID=34485 RepID=A0ACC2RM49_9FUNG|nr:hypothetical protein DSO57_1007308 [Entomophthora muscae]KAJ9051157.1 hypothetical protein DSO57_1007309 [Entomophthora muscae]